MIKVIKPGLISRSDERIGQGLVGQLGSYPNEK